MGVYTNLQISALLEALVDNELLGTLDELWYPRLSLADEDS